MVSLHRYKHNYRSCILFLFSLILFSKIVFGETVNTGNILTNSTFGTGNTTTTNGWSTSGDDGIHTHGEWGFPYQTGMDDSGGVLAFEGHEEDNVYQDVDLVGDGHLTQSEVNQGFTSTMEQTYGSGMVLKIRLLLNKLLQAQMVQYLHRLEI